MEETNETQAATYYPTVEKQAMGVGVPFKIESKEPREIHITGYAYYQKMCRENGPKKPLIGRYSLADPNQFQVYLNGGWVNKKLWDYAEEVVDKEGKAVLKANGKPKQRPLFDHKFEYLLKYDTPVEVEYYDKEQGQRVIKALDRFWLRVSKNLHTKISDQASDSRNTENSIFEIEYDDTLAPAEQYKVKYIKEG